MTDVFAHALSDFHSDDQQGSLWYRDGEEREAHDVAGYFEEWSPDETADGFWSDLEGPILDLGAGAGRQALYTQRHAETVAIEPSETLVDVLRDRGVENVRQADMFSLREQFDRDRFRQAYSIGTQVGMATSRPGLTQFLADLASVTTPDATVLFDGYDPTHARSRDRIGYRTDPAGETAYRIVQYEYDGDLAKPWLFRLFSPAEIRSVVEETDWNVIQIDHGEVDWEHFYNVTLEKQ